MVISCSSHGCKNQRKKGSDIHFHRFPLHRPQVLAKWVHAMKRKNFIPNKYSYLCSEHFNPEDYQDRPLSNIKLLFKTAVPSIFKYLPEHKKDQLVTCGNCKKQMLFEEYDSKHRKIHYNLCWLDGLEDKIDFMNTPKILNILRKTSSKNKSTRVFKCDQCDEIKPTMVGFAKHLSICKSNNSLTIYNNNIFQHNLEMLQIKVLRQQLKQRDAQIKSLEDLMDNLKKKLDEATMKLGNILEFGDEC